MKAIANTTATTTTRKAKAKDERIRREQLLRHPDRIVDGDIENCQLPGRK